MWAKHYTRHRTNTRRKNENKI